MSLTANIGKFLKFKSHIILREYKNYTYYKNVAIDKFVLDVIKKMIKQKYRVTETKNIIKCTYFMLFTREYEKVIESDNEAETLEMIEKYMMNLEFNVIKPRLTPYGFTINGCDYAGNIEYAVLLPKRPELLEQINHEGKNYSIEYFKYEKFEILMYTNMFGENHTFMRVGENIIYNAKFEIYEDIQEITDEYYKIICHENHGKKERCNFNVCADFDFVSAIEAIVKAEGVFVQSYLTFKWNIKVQIGKQYLITSDGQIFSGDVLSKPRFICEIGPKSTERYKFDENLYYILMSSNQISEITAEE